MGARAQLEEKKDKPLQLRQCRGYLHKTLQNEFKEIVDGFVNQAKQGSCAHMKLTAELLEQADMERQQQGKGSAQRLMEEIGE